ncbi:MAG: tetratricopeptide repeat protein [Alphaproteobacteria bacterium]|nr:tetratricopeptide repeat protein [Alphaproteobacteria bacterium]
MRLLPILIISLMLSGCDIGDDAPKGPVDRAALPPLTSREQALIFGADGAAQQGNLIAAERDYLSAVGISTGHVEAHLALARLYDTHNETAKEREILTRALLFQPNHPLANYMLGKLELAAARYAEARTAFERGLIQQPDSMDLIGGLGVAVDMLGEHARAQAIYLRAIRNNPKANLVSLRTNLAMSYLLSGTPKKALPLLVADAKKPNASSVTRHNLALAYGMLGRHGEARKILKGEMDEETRLLALARLKEYIREHAAGSTPPVPTPGIGHDGSGASAKKSPAGKSAFEAAVGGAK